MKQLIPYLTRKNLLCDNRHNLGLENYFALKDSKIYRLFKCQSCIDNTFYGLDYDFKPESEILSYSDSRLLRLSINQLRLIQDAEIYNANVKRVKNIESLVRELLKNETSNVS